MKQKIQFMLFNVLIAVSCTSCASLRKSNLERITLPDADFQQLSLSSTVIRLNVMLQDAAAKQNNQPPIVTIDDSRWCAPFFEPL